MLTIILTVLLVLVLLVLLWMLLICPSDTTPSFYEKFANRSYAHRGLHDENMPENSLPAFQAAADEGYGIELDIHMCKDGKIVVIHDDDFLRMCGDKRRVEQTGYQQIRKLCLSDTEYTVPLLTDVLDVVGGRVPLIVEFKSCENFQPFCDAAIKILDRYTGDFCMESFDPRIVRYIYKKRPDWMRGQLSCENADKEHRFRSFFLENLLTNIYAKPHFIAYRHEDMKNLNYRLSTGLLKGLSAAWTVRTEEDFERCCKRDADMIIFERFRAPHMLYDESESDRT